MFSLIPIFTLSPSLVKTTPQVFLDPDLFRPPGSSLRLFLMELIQKHYLEESFTPIIQDFCNRYDQARYGPEPFLEPEFNAYMALLDKMIVAIRTTHAIVSIPPEKRFYSSSAGGAGGTGANAETRRHPDSPERGAGGGSGGGGARLFRDKKRVVETAASTLIRNVMTRSKSDPADLAHPADVAALTNQFVRFRSKKSPGSIEETPNEMAEL